MNDREDFEAWFDRVTNNNHGVAYYVEIHGAYCFEDIEFAWKSWQAARNKPYILRKQAEAVLQCAEENKLRALGLIDNYILYDDLVYDAREMLEKANTLEQGEYP